MKTDIKTRLDEPIEFRQLPQAVGIEESVLSTCLLGGAQEVVELLEPHDFYVDRHRLIFSALITP